MSIATGGGNAAAVAATATGESMSTRRRPIAPLLARLTPLHCTDWASLLGSTIVRLTPVLSLLRHINKVGSRRRCSRGQIHQPPLAALLPVATRLPLISSAAMPATQRLRLWYRRLGRRGAAAGAAAFAAALVAAAFFLTPSRDASAPGNTPSYGHRLPTLVDLTLVDGAKEKGAVCLDGTPPGYHWLPGFSTWR
jgi:hypothetical protein